ncbi:MAG: hypothetical protein PHF20_09450, partial [Halothiobacillaceae bacterium]|nr:hypothetical protein [Halothiobacillaceae bacterium]
MSINYTSAGGSFQDAAYDFIGAKELGRNGWDLYPHDVNDGQLTIGAGLNLTSGKDVNKYAVYRALGINVSIGGVALSSIGTATQQSAEQAYVNRLNATLKSTSMTLDQKIDELHAIMGERAADSTLDGYANNRKAYFVFDAGSQQIRQSFDEASQEYDKALKIKLDAYDPRIWASTGFAVSKEHVVLLSLYWNGESLIGPNLMNALSTGNRPEAWYQIRYESNGNGIHTSRRYDESDMFGLYNNPSDVGDAEARQVYAMYTNHSDMMKDYDTRPNHSSL